MKSVAIERGYTLLLMILVLLAGSAATLAELALTSSARLRTDYFPDQLALRGARQALLNYTTVYPFLYGARGAGPGHLPCPDTDSMTLLAAPASMSRDGPNPPCGSGVFARGALPRHISLPGYRYAFHSEPFQRFGYVVSGQVINNPVNRIVNDGILDSNRAQQPLLAWVEQQPVDVGVSSQGNLHAPSRAQSRAPITRESLILAARLSVAVWVVERVNLHGGVRCGWDADAITGEQFSEFSGEASSQPPDGQQELWSLLADRSSGASFVSGSTQQPSMSSTPDAATQPTVSCTNSGTGYLMLDNIVLENVPATAHWFVRNRWHERLVIHPSVHCPGTVPGACTLVYEPYTHARKAGTHDTRLYFSWQATS